MTSFGVIEFSTRIGLCNYEGIIGKETGSGQSYQFGLISAAKSEGDEGGWEKPQKDFYLWTSATEAGVLKIRLNL